MIKEEVIIGDVRKIFQICEKYYSYDPTSIRISRTLEAYFEQELKNASATSTSKYYNMPKNNFPNEGSETKRSGEFENEIDLDSSSYGGTKKRGRKSNKDK